MNIELAIDQAMRLQEIIAEKHASALRMANADHLSDESRFHAAETADWCLDILNKLSQALFEHV